MKTLHQSSKWLILWCNFRNQIKLPPKESHHISFSLCKFRTKFYALNYGGFGGHGVAYEWMGMRVKIGVKTI